MVQWLRLHSPNAENSGSIPAQGTKFSQASWHNQTNKQKKKLKQNKTKKAEVAALIYNIADFGARKLSGIKKGIT